LASSRRTTPKRRKDVLVPARVTVVDRTSSYSSSCHVPVLRTAVLVLGAQSDGHSSKKEVAE